MLTEPGENPVSFFTIKRNYAVGLSAFIESQSLGIADWIALSSGLYLWTPFRRYSFETGSVKFTNVWGLFVFKNIFLKRRRNQFEYKHGSGNYPSESFLKTIATW